MVPQPLQGRHILSGDGQVPLQVKGVRVRGPVRQISSPAPDGPADQILRVMSIFRTSPSYSMSITSLIMATSASSLLSSASPVNCQ